MLKAILTHILILVNLICYSSQHDNFIYNNIKFFGEVSYTGIPLFIGNRGENRNIAISYDMNKAVSGLKFSGGVNFLIERVNIAFTYKTSMKYGHNYYSAFDSSNVSSISQSTISNIRGLTFDNIITISKEIELRNHSLLLGIGYSWLNFGSQYSYLTAASTTPKKVYLWGLFDFNFNGLVLNIDLKLKNYNLELNVIYVDKTNQQFRRNQSFLLPSVGLVKQIN